MTHVSSWDSCKSDQYVASSECFRGAVYLMADIWVRLTMSKFTQHLNKPWLYVCCLVEGDFIVERLRGYKAIPQGQIRSQHKFMLLSHWHRAAPWLFQKQQGWSSDSLGQDHWLPKVSRREAVISCVSVLGCWGTELSHNPGPSGPGSRSQDTCILRWCGCDTRCKAIP